MYAKITSTTWALDRSARSTLEGCDREFHHERSCLMQGYPPQPTHYTACTCYVSRIRLIETPLGEFVPTTEPDFRPEVKFWQDRTKRQERETNILWVALGLTSIGHFVLALI